MTREALYCSNCRLRPSSVNHLAVVAGLEEGYETVVRVIADPVHVLTVQKATKLVLGGVLSARKPIEVRFGSGTAQQEAPEE